MVHVSNEGVLWEGGWQQKLENRKHSVSVSSCVIIAFIS